MSSTRITQGMTQRNVLADLNRVNAQLAKTQARAASGKELTRPSDDPYRTARSLQLRESLASTQKYQSNAEEAQGWQDAAESAFSNITDIVHSAKELLVQGATDTSDPAARESIAKELDELIGSLKQNANATYGGRYIFGGTRTDQPPYVEGSDDAYKGTASVVARQVGPGVSLEIGIAGSSVLGSGQGAADGKILDTLRNAADHLRSGDAAALRDTDLKQLETNLDDLLGVRALNGARSNRLEAAVSRLSQVEESTLGQLSDTEDADLAETLISLNSQQAAYTAALKAGANLFQSSLMDFLR